MIESDEERYNMLLGTLPTPNLKGLLTLIWKTNPERRHNKHYKALITKFVKEYPKWGAKRIATLSISPSLRSRDHKLSSFPWIVKNEVVLSEKFMKFIPVTNEFY